MMKSKTSEKSIHCVEAGPFREMMKGFSIEVSETTFIMKRIIYSYG